MVGSTRIPTIPLGSARNVWGRVKYWPRAINFEGIPAQIMTLKDEINGFLKNEIILGTSFAWRTFVKDVTKSGMGLAGFASSRAATHSPLQGWEITDMLDSKCLPFLLHFYF